MYKCDIFIAILIDGGKRFLLFCLHLKGVYLYCIVNNTRTLSVFTWRHWLRILYYIHLVLFKIVSRLCWGSHMNKVASVLHTWTYTVAFQWVSYNLHFVSFCIFLSVFLIFPDQIFATVVLRCDILLLLCPLGLELLLVRFYFAPFWIIILTFI